MGIEHRLTKPRTPQTNGRVERFNGRISDILKTHHFLSGGGFGGDLAALAFLYNNQLPQSALGSQTPAQAMQKWFIANPELFHRKPDNRPGCDSYPLPKYCCQNPWLPCNTIISPKNFDFLTASFSIKESSE